MIKFSEKSCEKGTYVQKQISEGPGPVQLFSNVF